MLLLNDPKKARSFGAKISRMANLTGLSKIVTELRAERTNLASQLGHVDAALAVLGKLNGGRSYTKPRRHTVRCGTSAHCGGAARPLGQKEKCGTEYA